jgi:hypothetical protein
MSEGFELLPKDGSPPGRKPGWSTEGKKRFAAAFAVAAISDFFSVWLEFALPLQWALDFTTALLLFLILGRQWAILPGLIAEAIPGVAMFPVWVLVVVSIALWGKIRTSGR